MEIVTTISIIIHIRTVYEFLTVAIALLPRGVGSIVDVFVVVVVAAD